MIWVRSVLDAVAELGVAVAKSFYGPHLRGGERLVHLVDEIPDQGAALGCERLIHPRKSLFLCSSTLIRVILLTI